MNPSEIYNELIQGAYLQPSYDVVSNRPHPLSMPMERNCDNYWLFTAELHALCEGRLWQREWQKFWTDCKVWSPGLIARFPDRKQVGEDISIDELIGAASMDLTWAFCIAQEGEKRKWCFNVGEPGQFDLNYWYGRVIDFPATIRDFAGLGLSIWDQIFWAIGTVLSPFTITRNGIREERADTSGKKLKWLSVRRMRKGNYRLCDLAARFFRWRMSKQYPGGVAELYAEYFGPQHPLARHSQKDWS